MKVAGYDAVEEALRLGPCVVYRGRRKRDQQAVFVKMPGRLPARGVDVELLEREFELLSGLTLAGVPRVLELVRGDGLAALVVEDRGLRPLAQMFDAGRPDLPFFFQLATRLCAVLTELHRLDIIHGNVNPDSTLVSRGGDEVELLDFSLASRSAPDIRATAPVGSPAYRSPEQTGRVNRAIDYRTDFYSLGATLYHVLTGAPPFMSDDSLELIHAHLAKTPVPPAQVDPGVPEQVSRIVMRLLAKAPEDRYQSAHGIAHDLGVCLDEWSDRGTIPLFNLGQRDVSERFLVSQRLYGREKEVSELLSAFEETCAGRTALMLVAGYSGVGKTSLIHELYKPIVRQRGYFIAGKFDQVVRNIPYGALAQALRSLVWQILTESESGLQEWRGRLSDALGSNGGVLVEVIPEIELIIGPQAPPPPLEATEARNRFGFVFQSFLGALAGRTHPLVIFLDDLQWADAATLELLHALLTGSDIQHLLVIGAYRDNEVDAGHLLTWSVGRLETAGARVLRLSVPPLGLPDLVRFLGDTLHGAASDVEPLARLIMQKTDGNPFFVIQFLKALEQEGFFQFDRASGVWSFRLDAIASAGITDNVIDLMTRKIRRLPPAGQSVVTLAACIGNQFDWTTFMTVSRQPPEEAEAGLVEALEGGLIHPAPEPRETTAARPGGGARYAFLHDRVQQAAYELIPESRKHPVHLDVGRLLLAECGDDVPDDRIFEIVNHMNIGSALISDMAERLALTRLNLAAGRKAKVSTAYQAAAGYFEAGIGLLERSGGWTHADLMLPLYLEAAECQYLAGAFDQAEARFHELLERAETPIDRARVHSLRVTLYENQSRWSDAVSAGREGLAPFGILFPEHASDKQAALDREVESVQRECGAREIRSLVDLPVMTDASMRVAMRLLTLAWAPAYISGDALMARLMSATMVRLSLKHGHTEASAFGYATHAITIGPIRKDYRSAFEWGELALSVNERFNDARFRAKVHQQFQAHVNLWRRPFSTCIPHAREACRSGLESGDFVYAGYGAATEPWSAWLINRDLDGFVRDYTPTLALLEKIKMADFGSAHQILLNWARALQGRTSGPMSLSDAAFDEHLFVATYEHTSPFFLTFVYAAKLNLAVLHGQFREAIAYADRAKAAAAPGTIWPVLVDFWGGLAMAAVYPGADAGEQRALWPRLVSIERSLGELADNCPENFRCWWLLVSAELKRATSLGTEAIRLCEEALTYARQTRQLQHEALANELCGRNWLERDGEAMAAAFMREAHRCYAEWGASAKVAHLEREYSHLLGVSPAGQSHAGADARSRVASEPATLDMASVVKVAQAISVEIELDGLLRKLMTIALENAGAERGIFLGARDGRLVVEAEAVADPEKVEVGQALPLDQATGLAQSVVRYVHRTGRDVVIGDASADERSLGDGYVRRAHSKSILCVPVGHQGLIGGILYLENNLTTHAFTPDRTEMVRIIAAQTAISLENARLYTAMKGEVERRTLAEQALRSALSELEILKNRLETENVYLQEEIRTQHNFNEIVGNSPALLKTLHEVERVAPTESTVLILGETGSGKELFARAVHNRSRRNGRPLVKVNCGAIAPGLVESELFGHAKGAFTGAIERRIGRFEVADGGTIFLDEIGELPLEAQVKLLRVLQEQEFEPVGSSRTIRVSVRVIAATNRDLNDAVREGKFRADLLYRLNVFPIEIPPLRERRPDIRLLVNFMTAGLERKLGKRIQGFSARSMDRLATYDWPGNVRELQNVVERAAILSQGPVLDLEGTVLGGAAADDDRPVAAPPAARAPGTLDDAQRAHILNALRQTGGVIEGASGAATILGMHPNTLRSRMKKLRISAREGARN